MIRRLWLWLTYWPVPCESCNGTGICTGKTSKYPHSCCGDCRRKIVDWSAVPPGFDGSTASRKFRPLIGDGVMWRRPWSKRQVLRPRA